MDKNSGCSKNNVEFIHFLNPNNPVVILRFAILTINNVIKFVSELWQVSGFLCPSVSSTSKTDRNDITEIL